MPLRPNDRELVEQCLANQPRAWERFVNQFVGLVTHVINHTARSRSIRLSDQDSEDLAAEVFLAVIANDFAVLRRFRGDSSLWTYMTVIARRVVVRELLRRKSPTSLSEVEAEHLATEKGSAEQRIDDREQVEQLLSGLDGAEAEVVRLYHLEGKSYEEISSSVGMPANSVGPTLSRARAKLRRQ